MAGLRGLFGVIITLVAGVIVPLIILLSLFMVGEPPAVIAAWERGEIRVIGFDEVEMDTGYGVTERYVVRGLDPDDEMRELRIADDPLGYGAVNLFHAGTVHMARLSPGGNIAYPDGETGMFTFAAFTATPLILFVVLGIVFRPVITVLGLVVPAVAARADLIRSALGTGTALMSFITIPLFVMGLFWSLGEAPALRWFSPVENAQIVRVATQEYADGERRITAIGVHTPRIAFPEVIGFPATPLGEAEEALDRMGSTYPVRIYRHRPYALGWRWFDGVVIGVTAICLLIMAAGIAAIGRTILTGRPQRS